MPTPSIDGVAPQPLPDRQRLEYQDRDRCAGLTMNSESLSLRLLIRGRVQGVSYRAWAVRQARQLGLAGWVRNRVDGSVEAVVSGPASSVREMIERCRRGPPAAAVRSVEESTEAAPAEAGFRQLPTL